MFSFNWEIFSAAPRLQALRNREQAGPKAVGAAIRAYALELAQDKTTTFAQNIDNFIACTCESKEDKPQVKIIHRICMYYFFKLKQTIVY